MKDQKKLVFALIVAVVIAVAGGLLLASSSKKDSSMTDMNPPAATTPAENSPSTSQSQASEAVSATSVDIKNYAFTPAVIKVKVGDTVTWTNQDTVHHSVVADTEAADAPNGPLLAKGETYSFKFTKAGTYTYHCAPHTYMHGTVIVE